jgi:hypothetical protein
LCNGVIVKVPLDQLYRFDEREKGYRRVLLSAHDLEILDRPVPEGEVWIYIPEEPLPATEKYPIAQSYVDVIMDACIRVSEEFAIEFVETTEYWELPWVNDRVDPLYPRALPHLDYEKIDGILSHCLPEQFQHRKES